MMMRLVSIILVVALLSACASSKRASDATPLASFQFRPDATYMLTNDRARFANRQLCRFGDNRRLALQLGRNGTECKFVSDRGEIGALNGKSPVHPSIFG